MKTSHDGGMAFPVLDSLTTHDANRTVRFSAQSIGGMSLRDYFAAKAMAAAMTSEANPELAAARLQVAKLRRHTYEEHLAIEAYQIADAMLNARALQGER